MIFFTAILAGALFGALTARRRGGRPFDIAQYAAVYAIIAAILGLFLTIGINRIG